jgi:hypothetical protein
MKINDITYAVSGFVNMKQPKAEIRKVVLNLPEGHDK